MRILAIASLLASIPPFIILVHDRLYTDETKTKTRNSAIPESLVNDFKDVESSFYNLTDKSKLLIGSGLIGMIADPPDAEEKADAVFNEFEESYTTFSKSLRKLIATVRENEEQARDLLGSDWLKYENIVDTFENSDDTVNFAVDQAKTLGSAVFCNEKKFNSRLLSKVEGFVASEVTSAGACSDELLHYVVDNVSTVCSNTKEPYEQVSNALSKVESAVENLNKDFCKGSDSTN